MLPVRLDGGPGQAIGMGGRVADRAGHGMVSKGWVGVVAAAPVFAWEISVALWMIVKGFRTSSPVLRGVSPAATPTMAVAAA